MPLNILLLKHWLNPEHLGPGQRRGLYLCSLFVTSVEVQASKSYRLKVEVRACGNTGEGNRNLRPQLICLQLETVHDVWKGYIFEQYSMLDRTAWPKTYSQGHALQPIHQGALSPQGQHQIDKSQGWTKTKSLRLHFQSPKDLGYLGEIFEGQDYPPQCSVVQWDQN